LVAYLAQVGRTPFKPGLNDCALFLAGGVEAMTGVDHASDYRGRYTTIRGGVRILRRDGFEDHIALAEHHLTRKPIAFAQAGDGAVIPTETGHGLGIVQGANIYVLNESGLAIVPLTSASFALEL
jgi:hypothetical protein